MNSTTKTWSTPTTALKIERLERREGGPTRCWSAFGQRSWRSDLTGARRTGMIAVRIIEERDGGYRLDFCEAVAGAWLPWEPITTETYPTVAAARAALCAWRRALLGYKPCRRAAAQAAAAAEGAQ